MKLVCSTVYPETGYVATIFTYWLDWFCQLDRIGQSYSPLHHGHVPTASISFSVPKESRYYPVLYRMIVCQTVLRHVRLLEFLLVNAVLRIRLWSEFANHRFVLSGCLLSGSKPFGCLLHRCIPPRWLFSKYIVPYSFVNLGLLQYFLLSKSSVNNLSYDCCPTFWC